jgi:4-amino-4-deoxy-L-arabinose transferase-like glycosyltransferase
VRDLVHRNLWFFGIGATAATLLRALFLWRFPSVLNDSFIYGDIAKNWLLHGVYGLSGAAGIAPTYIRLPGYPAFLAFIFAIFGVEHYRAALVIQMFVDLGTCLLCASIAFRLLNERGAKIAFLLAALCPFLANYSAAALTETLEIFFTVLALDWALRALRTSAMRAWIVCGIACAAAILLRPDGAILPAVIVIYLAWRLLFRISIPNSRLNLAKAACSITIICVLPLIPWAFRNQRVFHRFQPLAPRYANEDNEFVPVGFNRWVKTWIADYASVEEIYWAVPGGPIETDKLPSRAFDTPRQRETTEQLITDYNQLLHISPALDRRFEALASERVRAHPLRYYFGLPALRILDMWLRPRTEILPSDTRWWEFNDDPKWSALAVSLGFIGLCYCVCALVGWVRVRSLGGSGFLLLFVVLRSGFLGTLENPEPRYTLEMYPVAIIFAAAALTLRHTNPKTEKAPDFSG